MILYAAVAELSSCQLKVPELTQLKMIAGRNLFHRILPYSDHCDEDNGASIYALSPNCKESRMIWNPQKKSDHHQI